MRFIRSPMLLISAILLVSISAKDAPDSVSCPATGHSKKPTTKPHERRKRSMNRLKNAEAGKGHTSSKSSSLQKRLANLHKQMNQDQVFMIVKSGNVEDLYRLHQKNKHMLDLNTRAYSLFDEGHLTTAMHIAVEYHDVKMVSALLKLGANPRTVDDFGWSPLHHAVANESPELVSILLDASGDHTVHNSSTTASSILEDLPQVNPVLSQIFEFWHAHGKHSDNHQKKYRVICPNGIAYRSIPAFDARLEYGHDQTGVYHNSILTAVKEEGDWIQITNGYWLPKMKTSPSDCRQMNMPCKMTQYLLKEYDGHPEL